MNFQRCRFLDYEMCKYDTTQIVSDAEVILSYCNECNFYKTCSETIHNKIRIKKETNIMDTINTIQVFEDDDLKFLNDFSSELNGVLENTHMWRTQEQRLSIINDDDKFPTRKDKYQQAMLEQKVQFEQVLVLAKEFEEKKLDLEELEYKKQSIIDGRKEINTSMSLLYGKDYKSSKEVIDLRRLDLNIQYTKFSLKNMKIAMKYRMKELKGWQIIMQELKEEWSYDYNKFSDELIEIKDLFNYNIEKEKENE